VARPFVEVLSREARLCAGENACDWVAGGGESFEERVCGGVCGDVDGGLNVRMWEAVVEDVGNGKGVWGDCNILEEL